LDEDGRAFAIKTGHTIVMASPKEINIMREKMQPVLDAYVKSMAEKGLPGREALDWCLNYLKTAPTE